MDGLLSVIRLHPHYQLALLQVTELRADEGEHLINAATLENVHVNVFLQKICKCPWKLANYFAMEMLKNRRPPNK